MRILEGLKSWLAEMEWEVETTVNEEDQSSSSVFGYQAGDDFECSGYFDTAEEAGLFKLFLYPKITVPEKQLDAVHVLVNAFNLGTTIGNFQLMADKRRVRYYSAVDVENADFSPALIANIVSAADWQLKDKLPRRVGVCFGGMTPEQAMEMEIEDA